MSDCVKSDCHPGKPRPPLTIPRPIIKPGVYHNVTVTIGQDGRIISIRDASKAIIYLCDPCQ